MKQISLKSEIHYFNTWEEFAKNFSITNTDLILTNAFNYEPLQKQIHSDPVVVLKENYTRGEPTDIVIDRIIKDIGSRQYDRVIAIGGGSMIDIAKVLTLSCVSSTQDLFEKKIPIIKMRQLIAIPTTVGTGSEVTNVTIAALEDKKIKLGLADDRLFPDYAVLIPEALCNLPFRVFVTSSIDALVHASESFLSPKATPFTKMYSKQAIGLILNGYQKILSKGKDSYREYLKEFLYASNYAGLAFGHAGTAVVHAMAYPLGGKYHVAHGEANYQFFIPCFQKYYEIDPEGKIKEIMEIFAEALNCGRDTALTEINRLLDQLLCRKPLREYGMEQEECALFAKSVIENQQRLLVNSYVPLSRQQIEKIYEERF